MKRTTGEDFAAGNKFTDGNPNTSTPATVVDSDWLNTVQEEIAGVVEFAGLTLNQTAYPGGDVTQLRQAIQILASGGGGGGGFQWTPVDGDAPTEGQEFGNQVYIFDNGAGQTLQAYLKVPQGYQAGSQIKMFLPLYSTAATGTVLMQTVSTLIRKNITAVDATTNQYSSTNTAITNATAKQYREIEIDLTDVDGEINSVAVAAGDIIKVELSRGTDLDLTAIRVMPEATEVRFT